MSESDKSTKEIQQDKYWVNNSFLIPENEVGDPYAIVYRTYNSAMGKFTNSSLGGNWVINPVPQISRYADPRETPLYHIQNSTHGMGGYHSEAIDDNYQKVHMRFGVPSFNSVVRFIANCYSIEASSLARTGKAPGGLFLAGRGVGAILALPIAAPLMVVRATKFLLNIQSSKYYTLKPTMHNYWSAVSLMVNNIAATLSIVPRVGERDYPDLGSKGARINGLDFSKGEARAFHKAIPGVFHPSGMIDVMQIATRTQIAGQVFHDELNGVLKDINDPKERARRLIGIVESVKAAKNKKSKSIIVEKMPAPLYLDEYLDMSLNDPMNQPESRANSGSVTEDGKQNAPLSTTINYMPETVEEHNNYLKRLSENFTANRKEGAEFVTFRVNNTGAQSESFTTSSKESGIASTINSMSGGMRDTRFNTGNGSIDSGGLIDTALSGVTSFFQGMASSFKLDGLGLLAGNAFVDIPKVPDGTSAEINRFNFTLNLRSPYGHDLSRLMNEIIPTCCILAGVLPQSTGRHSYTTPLMCEVFCRGRVHIRLGMIESVSITRGTGDVAWLRDGKWMGTDIQVSVADMTSVIHMPLQTGTGMVGNVVGAASAGLDAFVDTVKSSLGENNADQSNSFTTAAAMFMGGTYDDDSLYSDYMNILGSVEFDILVSRISVWGLRARRQVYAFNQFRSPANIMSGATSGIVGDVFKALSDRTGRGITGS